MLNLFIVDDHPLVVRSMCRVMEADFEVRIVGTATDGINFLRDITTTSPDVIVLDYYLPDMNADKVLVELRKFCRIPVLVLTGAPSSDMCREVFSHGADGYISKSAELEEICSAAQTLKDGGRYIDPRIAEGMALDSLLKENRSPVAHLTPREQEVLDLLQDGWKYTRIAEKLGLRVQTVCVYRDRILKKMKLESADELIRIGNQSK
ncbi:MAG: response regulator transcription factor [Candidatus Wallbacteria bacterium]|nr:response regulator transcription factor [Candidatus Wallbacteria bacterium]